MKRAFAFWHILPRTWIRLGLALAHHRSFIFILNDLVAWKNDMLLVYLHHLASREDMRHVLVL